MQPRLYLMQRGVTSGLFDQLVVSSFLHDAPGLNRDDPIGMPNRRQTMGNDQNRSSRRNPAHVTLDNVLALIVECAGRLVKDQDFLDR